MKLCLQVNFSLHCLFISMETQLLCICYGKIIRPSCKINSDVLVLQCVTVIFFISGGSMMMNRGFTVKCFTVLVALSHISAIHNAAGEFKSTP